MALPGGATAKTTTARRLKAGMESLGLVLGFICREKPYSEMRAGKLVSAVTRQLASGCHVCLVAEERMVGYAGWQPIGQRNGEAWLRNEEQLKPVSPEAADAVALTIVSVTERAHIPPLIRACRSSAARQPVFFKREYPGGRSKKAAVLNCKA